MIDEKKKLNVTDDYVIFHSGVFSNWHHCKIVFDHHVFYSSEQLFMYFKALFFSDEETAIEILSVINPADAKALGRKVKNYNEVRWNEARYNYMYIAIKAKFDQNPNLRKELLSYGNRKFVEGSPKDTIWGIGIDWKEKMAEDDYYWKGSNLLGRCLTEIRNDYLKDINPELF